MPTLPRCRCHVCSSASYQRSGSATVVGTGKELPQLPPERQPLTAVQEAGDVLFVPAGWSHAILNLREGIGLAEEFELSHW